MSEIRISPGVQLLALGGVLTAIGAAAAAQFPEIRRYLKIKTM